MIRIKNKVGAGYIDLFIGAGLLTVVIYVLSSASNFISRATQKSDFSTQGIFLSQSIANLIIGMPEAALKNLITLKGALNSEYTSGDLTWLTDWEQAHQLSSIKLKIEFFEGADITIPKVWTAALTDYNKYHHKITVKISKTVNGSADFNMEWSEWDYAKIE